MNEPAQTFLACAGTRPEIIKMAMLVRELRARGHRVVVLHTGQHEEMAHELYRFFEIPPDIVIDLRRESGGLTHLTTALMNGIEDAIASAAPDAVLVQGDTNSAFAGALVGYYQRLPVAHVEAGLRTRQREPFPEEKNREMIARLARWHFAPTAQARRNLIEEGIGAECIHEVGNTVIDAALWTRDCISRPDFDLAHYAPRELCRFLERQQGRPIMLVTAHRRENWGQPIADIATAVARLLQQHPQSVAVWPVHPNPAVLADIERGLRGIAPEARERIDLTSPLEYPAMMALLSRSHLALTDSGGIQEEAAALRIPVLIARASTERQELVDAGGAVLVGTDIETMVRKAASLLRDPQAQKAMQVQRCPFGDGRSARRIAGILSDERMRKAS